MKFLDFVYKFKKIIEFVIFGLALYTIIIFGTFVGLDKGAGGGPPESMKYLVHFFIVSFIVSKIFGKFIKKSIDVRKTFLYSLSYIVIALLIVMLIQVLAVLVRKNNVLVELQQKNIVLSEEVCYDGGAGGTVDLDRACWQLLEMSDYNIEDGCYARLLPRVPSSKKCTECLIICE